MPDYKEMYLTLFRACEQAAEILMTAQQRCEERYLQDMEHSQDYLRVLEKRKADVPPEQ